MLKCVNLIEIRFYTYFHASSFLVLWDHCADTGSWIRGEIRIYEGKYGYLRANTDICPVFTLRNDTLKLETKLWFLTKTLFYHIFCCNMFVFACPIIADSQCWLFALRVNTGQISVFALKYPYLPSYIRISPRIQ
jgi:hypothetical protein